MPIDLNTAGEQRSFEVIPPKTEVTLHLTIRPGGAGEGGWLRRSANGQSEGLDCEFVVVDEGPHKGRKLWQLFTLSGTTPGHADAGNISLRTLKAIVGSAKGIKPDDTSDAANAARTLDSWGDLDQLRFVARIGVRPPEGNYPTKNRIDEVITPGMPTWKQPVQIDRSTIRYSGGGGNGGAMPVAENSIARPQWATN
jgi:hypothetical protein